MKKLIIVFILSLIFCDNQIIKSVELDSLGKDTLSQYFCKDGQLFKYIKYIIILKIIRRDYEII